MPGTWDIPEQSCRNGVEIAKGEAKSDARCRAGGMELPVPFEEQMIIS